MDAKLGEFETTLSDLLRTVNNDRSALRRGAGVRSRGESRGDSRADARPEGREVRGDARSESWERGESRPRRAPRAPRDY